MSIKRVLLKGVFNQTWICTLLIGGESIEKQQMNVIQFALIVPLSGSLCHEQVTCKRKR